MKRAALVLLATLLVTFGVGEVLARPGVSWAAPAPDVKGRNLDAQLAAIAERVPGFGGLFFDEDGGPTIYVRDVGGAPAARAAEGGVRTRLRSGNWRASGASRRPRWSFPRSSR